MWSCGDVAAAALHFRSAWAATAEGCTPAASPPGRRCTGIVHTKLDLTCVTCYFDIPCIAEGSGDMYPEV